jgi:hypothetical protein
MAPIAEKQFEYRKQTVFSQDVVTLAKSCTVKYFSPFRLAVYSRMITVKSGDYSFGIGENSVPVTGKGKEKIKKNKLRH